MLFADKIQLLIADCETSKAEPVAFKIEWV